MNRFRTRTPQRKPDKAYLYFNGKGYSVTAAWGSRRATVRFKRQADASRFARSLRCKLVKGSEYSHLPKALQAAIQKKVPVIMREEGYPRGQAFAAAVSMAIRGTLRKKSRTTKSRARIKPKKSKRSRAKR